MLAWLDGELVERERARVPADDFAFRYGAACFETMLARGGRVFRLDAHLERLRAGLGAMGVQPPEPALLASAVEETLRANRLAEASVRLTVTAGQGRAPDLGVARGRTVLVTADPLQAPPAPASLAIVSVEVDERRPVATAKTGNFLTYLLARAEARRAGADEALLLNHAGAVCETATGNIFAVLDGVLVTPSLADGPIVGITRAAVLECARTGGVPAEERSVRPADLERASEAFATNSLAGLRPVVAIEGRGTAARFAADGPVTSRLRAAYEALVREECGVPA